MDIEKIKNEFDKFTKNYDLAEKPILKKYNHSYRVMKISKEISESINLNEEEIYISMVIGLLHDYSRFEQWAKYKTYSDINSIDHGDLAIQKLFDNNEIEKFNIKKEYYKYIYDAIKYHNKYNYPENLDKKNKLFCKIIRDADKLDIIYLLGLKEEKAKEDDSEISKEVEKYFFENKLVRRTGKINLSDNILLKLALVYDLNFLYSYKYIRENKLIDNMFETLENKEKYKLYFDYIKNYVKEKERVYVRKKI